MKKIILILATASAVVAGMASCKKEHTPKEAIKQTINVSIKANEAYTFVLPKNLRDDPYEITSQPVNYTISDFGEDSLGNRVYLYLPSKDYTGTDAVVLSNNQERANHQQHTQGPPPSGCSKGTPPNAGGSKCNGHHKEKCKGGEEDHYIITINFTIENSSANGVTN